MPSAETELPMTSKGQRFAASCRRTAVISGGRDGEGEWDEREFVFRRISCKTWL